MKGPYTLVHHVDAKLHYLHRKGVIRGADLWHDSGRLVPSHDQLNDGHVEDPERKRYVLGHASIEVVIVELT